jgi:ATP-dependent DNA ligase
MRVLVAIDQAGSVSIRSRIGTDKTAQFPEIADTLARIPPLRDAMLDAIVAVGRRGEPLGFPRLEPRIALTTRGTSTRRDDRSRRRS